MPGSFVPIIVAFVLPFLWLAAERGWLARGWVRGVGGAAGIALLVSSFPLDGVPPVYIEHNCLLLAGAAALLLALRHLRVPWTMDRRFLVALAAVAGLSLISYFNFFAFHGGGKFVQLPDMAHYYLGSKYFGELGYKNLYSAMLAAEEELSGGRLASPIARDLETYEEVPVGELLRSGRAIRERFEPERWKEFKEDVELVRSHLAPEQWGRLLLDHGFNATPAWVVLGRAFSLRVPGGSGQGLVLLSLLDVGLLVTLFGAVYWAFGIRSLLLSLILFSVAFGAGFDWTGGSFLRYGWLFGVVVGSCCLKKERHLAAGVLIASATWLRLFPGLLLVPLVARAAVSTWRRRSIPRQYRLLIGSFVTASALIFLLTGLLPRGWSSWLDFGAHMSGHVESLSANTVGLTEVLAFQADPGPMTREEFRSRYERRQGIYRFQLLLAFLPLLLLVLGRSQRGSDFESAMLALPLIFTGLSLASYYYVLLMLVVVRERKSPSHLAAVFGVEAASRLVTLFVEPVLASYFYRSVLIGWLYLLVFLPSGVRDDESLATGGPKTQGDPAPSSRSRRKRQRR